MQVLPHHAEATGDAADSWSYPDMVHYLKYTDISKSSPKQRIKHMTLPVLLPIVILERNARLETSIKMKEKGTHHSPLLVLIEVC